MEKLRAEFLRLPDKDRAELALQLMASLDGAPEPDAEQAWEAEILRRVAEIDAGTAKGPRCPRRRSTWTTARSSSTSKWRASSLIFPPSTRRASPTLPAPARLLTPLRSVGYWLTGAIRSLRLWKPIWPLPGVYEHGAADTSG